MSAQRQPVDISIVIPAFNEERRLGASLDEIGRYLRRLSSSATR